MSQLPSLSAGRTPDGRICFIRDEAFALFEKLCNIGGVNFKDELSKKVLEFDSEAKSFAIELDVNDKLPFVDENKDKLEEKR